MEKEQDYLANGFQNVDGQNSVEKFKTCLTFVDSLPSFQRYKKVTDELLAFDQGVHFADIGCGLGFDVERIARKISGNVVGIDASQELLREARTRVKAAGLSNASFVSGDARNLKMQDGSFDGARTDRALQHIDNPHLAVAEMGRIVRRHGTIVCAEPDWGSFLIDDDRTECVRAVSEEWVSQFKNPHIGRRLPRMMHSLGFTDLEIRGELLVTSGIDQVNLVFDVEKTCERLDRKLGSSKFVSWYEELRLRDRSSPVFVGVTLVIVAGRKG
ncbi:MAG: hypothetical protein C5B49_13625 [Bdellovibrio sp.]|nr:MAG: hypothetical protein C5B49_13625 [Bdellovibrio sp.]